MKIDSQELSPQYRIFFYTDPSILNIHLLTWRGSNAAQLKCFLGLEVEYVSRFFVRLTHCFILFNVKSRYLFSWRSRQDLPSSAAARQGPGTSYGTRIGGADSSFNAPSKVTTAVPSWCSTANTTAPALATFQNLNFSIYIYT